MYIRADTLKPREMKSISITKAYIAIKSLYYISCIKLCISYIKLAPHNRIPFVGQAAAC